MLRVPHGAFHGSARAYLRSSPRHDRPSKDHYNTVYNLHVIVLFKHASIIIMDVACWPTSSLTAIESVLAVCCFGCPGPRFFVYLF